MTFPVTGTGVDEAVVQKYSLPFTPITKKMSESQTAAENLKT